MYAVDGVAHSLPLGDIVRDFPFTENETRRHFSYLSGTFREHFGFKKLYTLNGLRDPPCNCLRGDQTMENLT